MSIDTEKREDMARVSEGHRLQHVFPFHLNVDAYAIGAVAYCGFIRTRPWAGLRYDGRRHPDLCIVCAEMDDAYGH